MIHEPDGGVGEQRTAGALVREVLAASQGTQRMQEIARAVQEGAAAYLRRQFRTLGVFVVIIFFVLLVLPADHASAEIKLLLLATNSKECSISLVSQATKRWFLY
jgi:Na+/H+-translocating membrane pyrophosphatase